MSCLARCMPVFLALIATTTVAQTTSDAWQDYATKPIRIISIGAIGATDLWARMH
jgi:hypothetical protein